MDLEISISNQGGFSGKRCRVVELDARFSMLDYDRIYKRIRGRCFGFFSEDYSPAGGRTITEPRVL